MSPEGRRHRSRREGGRATSQCWLAACALTTYLPSFHAAPLSLSLSLSLLSSLHGLTYATIYNSQLTYVPLLSLAAATFGLAAAAVRLLTPTRTDADGRTDGHTRTRAQSVDVPRVQPPTASCSRLAVSLRRSPAAARSLAPYRQTLYTHMQRFA